VGLPFIHLRDIWSYTLEIYTHLQVSLHENSVRTAFPLSTPQKSMGTRFPRVPTPQHHWVCLTYQYKKLKYLRLFSCIHLMGWASPQNLLLNEKRRILPLARSYFPSCTSMCGFYQLKFDTNRIF